MSCVPASAALLLLALWAQKPTAPATPTVTRAAATPVAGEIANGVYRNRDFGLAYRIPVGWVDRTQDMQSGNDAAKGLVLLAIFERPPEATGESVNSAVVIAAEPAASYPGLKTAADYFSPLTELATAKGFQVVNPPYEFSLGSKSLARSDFTKSLGKQGMRQASLVEMRKGYFVSFTFIAGEDDELEEIIQRLSLAERTTKNRK